MFTAMPGAAFAASSASSPASFDRSHVAAAEAGLASYYQSRRNAPIWLTPKSAGAAEQLVSILRRAPIDGLAAGPELAAHAEAALAQARSGDAAAVLAADKLLSSAWVSYVRAVTRPTAGMVYGEAHLAPRVPSAAQILHRAANAGSLAEHVRSVANVNPVYAELRDAAWNQAQLAGGNVDRRVLANLERARALPGSGRFVLVDAASQQLYMYENGRVVDQMKVIVGKPEHATPMIASTLYYATLNPYWNVPGDLLIERIVPHVLKEGPGYLKAKGYEVLSGFGPDAQPIDPASVDWRAVAEGRAQVRVRQLPGPGNSMGAVKFSFPNTGDIYLHDTPQKELFAEARRTFSGGCVRLEDAKRLGRWLLGRDPVASSPEPEQHVQLPKGVPIYITYLTAQANGGQLTYVEDVYRRDMGTTRVASGF
jgi:murein L,D-transpeptidase YcbB/YkuD